MGDSRVSGIGMTSARTRERLVARLRETGIGDSQRSGSHPQRPEAPVRRRGAGEPGLRGHRAAARARADDLAALHRRPNDRGADSKAARRARCSKSARVAGTRQRSWLPGGHAVQRRAHRRAAAARTQGAARSPDPQRPHATWRRLSEGWAAYAPVTTGSSSRPPRTRCRRPCSSSSRHGGRLVIPVGPEREQQLIRITRRGDAFEPSAARGGDVRAPARWDLVIVSVTVGQERRDDRTTLGSMTL